MKYPVGTSTSKIEHQTTSQKFRDNDPFASSQIHKLETAPWRTTVRLSSIIITGCALYWCVFHMDLPPFLPEDHFFYKVCVGLLELTISVSPNGNFKWYWNDYRLGNGKADKWKSFGGFQKSDSSNKDQLYNKKDVYYKFVHAKTYFTELLVIYYTIPTPIGDAAFEVVRERMDSCCCRIRAFFLDNITYPDRPPNNNMTAWNMWIRIRKNLKCHTRLNLGNTSNNSTGIGEGVGIFEHDSKNVSVGSPGRVHSTSLRMPVSKQ
jgi:hypothetical protein